ncbi:MAG: DUF2218 domain-containing protein [Hyphomicrobiales bacterium]|nr:DUF2218 domain-containing protein [Hyphomicrobiales bacterium]
MLQATAEIATASASRYLQQLCKHFAHKIETEFTPTEGHMTFPLGPVSLAADAERLTIVVAAEDAERLAELEDVVARHLVRFAFREELALDWRAA